MLVFSQEVLKDEMYKLYDEALEEAVSVIQGNEWFKGTTPTKKDMEGYDSYTEVEANNYKAWIIEYGQGKDAEFWRNPYWEEYVRRSGLTNRWRLTDPRIRQRGFSAIGHETVNFDENRIQTIHGGNPEGRLLDDDDQEAYAYEAEPFLQDLMEKARQTFIQSVNTKLESFDLGTCFITTTEHA